MAGNKPLINPKADAAMILESGTICLYAKGILIESIPGPSAQDMLGQTQEWRTYAAVRDEIVQQWSITDKGNNVHTPPQK